MKKFYPVAALLVMIVVSCASKQATEINTVSSRAIDGYDPVSYFTDAKAMKGSEEFSFTWKNASWLFSSRQNLDSFAANPEKYAPQYGGWCAFGCSNGRKATTDPNAWTIVGGKLYLNHNPEVRERWVKEQEQRIEKADQNWPKLRDE